MNDLTFKERMIFELEKDDYIRGCKNTTKIWCNRYNISISDARKIYQIVVNYQIETYGHEKNSYYEEHRDYVKNFRYKTARKRKNNVISSNVSNELKKFERRNEKCDSDF